jgi:predicted permease
MPVGFQFPYRIPPTDLWIPWALRQWAQNPRVRVDFVVARLKAGAAIDAARTELDTIEERLSNSPDANERSGANVTPLSDVVVGSVRPALLTLWGAVGVVLLIACTNVMNLLLARGAARTHELALRAALGASRSRLIQQLLTESVLMSVAGAAAGLLLASFSTNLILNLASSRIPRLGEIGFDWRIFAFLMIAGVGAGIFFGLLPALAASRLDLQMGHQNTSRSAGYGSSGWSGHRLRDGLVVAEIAMAFVLVIGASSMLRAFLRLQSTPTGFVSNNVLTLHLSVSLAEYEARGSYGRYLSELEERIGRIPGVQGVGFIQYLPLQNWGWTGFFSIPKRSPYPPGHEPRAELRFVTPGYFTALGIPIRRGRAFNAHDTSDSQGVILINEALSRRYFPNEDPVGQRIDRGIIIGVVGDVRQSGLDRPATPEIYHPFVQNTGATSEAGVSVVIRAHARPEALANAVRNAIHQVNPNQTVFSVKTMSQVIAESLGDLTLYLWLIGFFAGLAILLAITGTYGVVSYAAARRTREFAIRVALGADRCQISKLVLGHGCLLLALGLAVGTAGALMLTRTLMSLSSSVTSPNPATLTFVGLLLATVALSAYLMPAHRATRVDPNVSLKYE